MKKTTDTPFSQYALIACLSLTLLLGQAFRLHMHLQHEETPVTHKSIIDVHIASVKHNDLSDTHHQDSSPNHHLDEIEINLAEVIKKSQWSNLLMLLFIAGFFLRSPIFQCIRRRFTFESKLDSLYYLLHPPLRAPPLMPLSRGCI